MTDDLHALIRQWLELLTQPSGAASSDDWQSLILQLQTHAWQEMPAHQAEILATLTSQSIEFTRFAGQLIQQLEAGEPLSNTQLLLQFHQHLTRLTQEWVLQRWQMPEQLAGLIRLQQLDTAPWLENPLLRHLQALLETPLPQLDIPQRERLQQSLALLQEHQQALQLYSGHYQRINREALDTFATALDAEAETLESLEQLHRLWCDSYEQCHQRLLDNTEFQLAHARVGNAAMRLRLFMQQQSDQHLSRLGIASSSQLEIAFKQIHQLRKQLRDLQQQIDQLHTLPTEH